MEGKNVFDTLRERGYIAQCTAEDEVRRLLAKESVTFYIGFDPTADSLHVGHFLALMAMSHLQRAGHRPISLVGGGTGTVGDPSGRTDMRRVMTDDEIALNSERFRGQMSRFIDFSEGRALMVNNGDWLRELNHIDFLREVGAHFSVNRMLAAECYKNRLETGLTFLEFNYMTMQAYDFLTLHRRYGCMLQLGGDDQWSNIIAGVELIRRKGEGAAFGLTLNLLTKSDGKKMGKTASGALWLDPEKTSPYDFYQYWRNVDDGDVKKCLSLLTFMPMDEIGRLTSHMDERMNEAKKTLAFEVTRLVHGEDAARSAKASAEAVFGGSGGGEVPAVVIERDGLGKKLIDTLARAGVVASKSEGKRLVVQGGLTLNGTRVTDVDASLSEEDFTDGTALIRKGKKKFYRLILT